MTAFNTSPTIRLLVAASTAKNTGFLFMVIASMFAYQVKHAACAQQQTKASIGNSAGMLAQRTCSRDSR